MSSLRAQSPSGPWTGLTIALLLLSSTAVAAGDPRDLRVVGEAPVRSWAARNAPAVEVVRPGGFVTLEGSVEAPWYRVRTTAGRLGWVAGTIAEGQLNADEGLASKPAAYSGSLRLLSSVELRGGPAFGRPVAHLLEAGSMLRVLDQYGTWVQLGDAEGRSGWAEASSFVASLVEQSVAPTALPEAEVAVETKADKAALAGKEAAEPSAEAPADGSDGPSGAELRRLRLEERRAARDEAQAADKAAEQERLAEREARRLEAEREKALGAKQQEAEQAEAVALKEAEEAAKLAREAAAAAEKSARAAEVAVAEAQPPASVEPSGEGEIDDAERKRQARAEAAARKAEGKAAAEALEAAERTAEAARKAEEKAAAEALEEEERAAAEAEKQAAAEAKAAERLAKKEANQAPKEQAVREAVPPVQVQQIPDGPVAPADIPASLGVTLGKKAPAEKKTDPASSPLAQEVLAAFDPSAPPLLDPVAPVEGRSPPKDAGAAEFLRDFKPYDEKAQLARSVEAVHEDPKRALDLSSAEASSPRSNSLYVNDAGDMVDTTIVSEIVLRAGSEILTLGEFERRVAEVRESESVRSGEAPSIDDARRMVMGELVEALLLIHHGRAIGIRFDAVYESAKEDFKKSGGITDDLELLRLLDEMGMTFKDFRREMIRRTVPRLVVRTQVMGDMTLPEEEIDNYYRRHQDEWVQADCVLLRELVLQPEARETTRDFNLRLEEILKRIEAGEDFCDLARRHSRSPSAAQCGQLKDCFAFEQLDEKVARVAFKMRPGDIEPIGTDWGYHLLQLEEHRPGRVRTLEEVRDSIVRQLQRDRLAEQVPRFIEELRRTVRIEVSPAFQRYWDETSRGGLGR